MKLKDFVAISFLILALALTGCGGGSSAQVQPPPPPTVPTISAITPTSATAGSADLSLTVMGSNFDGTGVIRSRILWSANGSQMPLITTFVSSSELTAIVPAALLLSAGTVSILVQNWDHIEGVSDGVTNSITFTVKSSSSSAALVSPPSVTLGLGGARQFLFSINGAKADATWSVDEGPAGGTVSSTGIYSAPKDPGTFHVVGTSAIDPSKTATATVSVTAAGFTLTGSMHTARSGHTATLLANGKVLIVGSGDVSPELFDSATGSFIAAGTMTTIRFGATVTLLASGKVLITGGFGPSTSQLPRLNTAELYDPQSGTFTPTGSMSVGRIGHTATLLNDGKVLIAGGTHSSGGGGAATASAELYDPSTGTFTVTGSMASERADHTATLLVSGEVLIVGGWNGHAADAPDDPPWDPLFAELFEPSSGSFKSTGTMSTTRNGHSAIQLFDGKVLVLGGVPALQNVHQQLDPQYAELYDPVAGTFSSAGNFTVSSTKYTATLLNNGMVLIAGGEQAAIVVTYAELLDPATGTLSATGGLVIARTGHTATRLNDGRVLVVGGTDGNGNALASAELYQ